MGGKKKKYIVYFSTVNLAPMYQEGGEQKQEAGMDQWGDTEERETVVCVCEKKMAYEFSRGQNSWWEWRGELP